MTVPKTDSALLDAPGSMLEDRDRLIFKRHIPKQSGFTVWVGATLPPLSGQEVGLEDQKIRVSVPALPLTVKTLDKLAHLSVPPFPYL